MICPGGLLSAYFAVPVSVLWGGVAVAKKVNN
jgi:hypothetical protein